MATDIVQGLFGMTPESYQQQRDAEAYKRAAAFGQMDPMQAARTSIYYGANQLGGAIGGMLGAEDPQLVRIRQQQQVLSGLDVNDIKSIAEATIRANQMGNPQLALQLSALGDKVLERQDLSLQRQDLSVKRQDELRQRQAAAASLARTQAARDVVSRNLSVTPENIYGQSVESVPEVDEQGYPLRSTLPGYQPPELKFDYARLLPQLVGTPEGRAELATIVASQKAMRPETFDLAEGTKRYGYDAAGNVIKIAGVDKEKPQPTFGTEAERIAKAEYGRRYGELTPEESLIVNKKVDAVELLKVPKIVVDVKDPTAVAKASLDTMNKWEGFLKSSGDVELANRYSNLQSSIELARKGNPNADGASLYNLAKIYDPSGAVQEGDKKSILGNASIPDRVKLLAQQFYVGGSFTPQQRTNMLAIAKEIRDQRNTQIERYRKEYVNVIIKFGGSPESIFNPYSINQQPANLSSIITAPASN